MWIFSLKTVQTDDTRHHQVLLFLQILFLLQRSSRSTFLLLLRLIHFILCSKKYNSNNFISSEVSLRSTLIASDQVVSTTHSVAGWSFIQVTTHSNQELHCLLESFVLGLAPLYINQLACQERCSHPSKNS
jgi:hypothetical protein